MSCCVCQRELQRADNRIASVGARRCIENPLCVPHVPQVRGLLFQDFLGALQLLGRKRQLIGPH